MRSYIHPFVMDLNIHYTVGHRLRPLVALTVSELGERDSKHRLIGLEKGIMLLAVLGKHSSFTRIHPLSVS